MNYELHYEITNFLQREAYILDSLQFQEWLGLLTDDIIYRMPLRVTREKKDGSNIVDEMTYFEETKKSLITRVSRMATTSAWAWDPVPRTRHFINNILIERETRKDELEVRSAFLFMRSRAKDEVSDQVYGERLDILRRVDGQWKIAARTIYPDQTVLTSINLSSFF
ncbi:3-phenylpropionate/cinnamic acid dioxygenase subunit beta [Paenibacillus validus]|uniref:3-phenylpropionate/cinnamic acid dioxygenase subunit beta n=1 Tax=Paenibacillus TaxID=44249 RepID=UPI0006D00C82|nr:MULTISPECIES: 3-phenylpropionate/cinnamic acid dioxygenase subunit beta [Paenibacillus]MED4603274.1 3-phenylpropionate/cinnamic acid dioxygenase subunit beta [Paenibacillus validus]MED4605273.1 3-phenylpropionate/cinnamic acid dioxygenase subunit beta [Paenibacillus validus]